MSPFDYFTACSCHIELFFKNRSLAHGTGFFYLRHQRLFFVTALHNVTGINWETGQNISSNGGRPDSIKITMWFHNKVRSDLFIGSGSYQFDIYDEEKPIWIEHRDFGSKVDIAIFDCARIAKSPKLFSDMNDFTQFEEVFSNGRDFADFTPVSFTDHPVKIPYVNEASGPYWPVVGQDVFVIGYPLRFASAGQFPIWKRGSVATEPQMDHLERPTFLIDSVTREGLSGSPVVGDYVKSAFEMPGKGVLTRIGTVRAFAGVYTARIGAKDDFSAQMGLVWKQGAMDQIIDGAEN